MTDHVSIIIRAKNEERWIGRCLKMVFRQSHPAFDVVVVDNNSSDHTLEIAKKFPVQIVTIDDFTPGRAINLGVEATDGRYLACLSAHCIPRDTDWLTALARNLDDKRIAGVYGRQLPFLYSSAFNKRDLLITFGLDHRVQTKDSFFHNANSCIRRDVWEELPFDESLSNIEDRAWGMKVIEAGYCIAYEPEAAVYHYHGIHQDHDERRARSVVRVMESLDASSPDAALPVGFRPDSINAIAILPVVGEPTIVEGVNLLSRCIEQVRTCELVRRVVVLAENAEAIATARKAGAEVCVRPETLLPPATSVEDALQYALQWSEDGGDCIDAVVFVNSLYPFRPPEFFEGLVTGFAQTGVDSLVPATADYHAAWVEGEGTFKRVDSGFRPRERRSALHLGLVGLGVITSSEYVRRGRLLGENVGLVPVEAFPHSLKADSVLGRELVGFALNRLPEVGQAPPAMAKASP